MTDSVGHIGCLMFQMPPVTSRLTSVKGGSCHDYVNIFSCTCMSSFQGDHCEIEIDECQDQPCQNGALCPEGVLMSKTFVCVWEIWILWSRTRNACIMLACIASLFIGKVISTETERSVTKNLYRSGTAATALRPPSLGDTVKLLSLHAIPSPVSTAPPVWRTRGTIHVKLARYSTVQYCHTVTEQKAQ